MTQLDKVYELQTWTLKVPNATFLFLSLYYTTLCPFVVALNPKLPQIHSSSLKLKLQAYNSRIFLILMDIRVSFIEAHRHKDKWEKKKIPHRCVNTDGNKSMFILNVAYGKKNLAIMRYPMTYVQGLMPITW